MFLFRWKKVLTQVSIRVSMLVFGQIQVGLEFVLCVSTILGYHYRASTRLKLQSFGIRLNNEPQVETPFAPIFADISCKFKIIVQITIPLMWTFTMKKYHSYKIKKILFFSNQIITSDAPNYWGTGTLNFLFQWFYNVI